MLTILIYDFWLPGFTILFLKDKLKFPLEKFLHELQAYLTWKFTLFWYLRCHILSKIIVSIWKIFSSIFDDTYMDSLLSRVCFCWEEYSQGAVVLDDGPLIRILIRTFIMCSYSIHDKKEGNFMLIPVSDLITVIAVGNFYIYRI